MDNKEEVVMLYLDDIIPNRFQPREVFEDNALKELAISIKEHGVIQPIIVRKIGEKYEIIAGERRYKASTMVGLTQIPAIIKNMDDKESSKVALIENLQRKDLTPIEEARTYQKILDLDEMTQEELAKTMGKSQSAVSNKLRLLSLPEEVQDALLHEEISERHARSLLNLNNPRQQVDLLRKIISSRMTVRDLDKEIKQLQAESAPTPAPASQPVQVQPTPVEAPKPSNNLEYLGGINHQVSPLTPPKPETPIVQEAIPIAPVTNNVTQPIDTPVNVTPLSTAPKVEPVGNNALPGMAKPVIQQPVQPQPLIDLSQAKPVEKHDVDTIEILDLDGQGSSPKTIPLISVKKSSTTATNKIKETVENLKKEGYKIDISESDNPVAYEITIKINKE